VGATSDPCGPLRRVQNSLKVLSALLNVGEFAQEEFTQLWFLSQLRIETS
jgi:hypothetical protein